MAGSELKIDILGAGAAPPPAIETNPPFLQNENPAPAEINVEKERDIFFRVTDAADQPESGIDIGTLNVEIKQGAGPWVSAIISSVFQAGFSGSIVDVFSNTLSYDVTINPTAYLTDGAVVQVRVQVRDLTLLANMLDTTYSFTVEAAELNPPFISNESPARSASSVLSTVPISFRVTDASDQVDSGVDISTLQVQVEDGLGSGYVNAILAGSFVGGFTGSITNLGGGLSYDVSINPPGGNWTQLDRVSIIVDVDDTKS